MLKKTLEAGGRRIIGMSKINTIVMWWLGLLGCVCCIVEVVLKK